MNAKRITTDQLKQARRERRELFIASGLRPLQALLSLALWLLVGSRLWEIKYVAEHYGLERVSLGSVVVPLIFIIVWVMQFQYMRHWVRSMAIVTVVCFLAFLPLRRDNFALATYLGELVLLTTSVALFLKMKNPAFSTIEPNNAMHWTPR